MKSLILAGGYGTRLSEHTGLIPKPMLEIGNQPIIWHIMCHYASYGIKDFVISVGYKSSFIKEFFAKMPYLSSDLFVNFSDHSIKQLTPSEKDWKVTVVDTGTQAMTGGRILNARKYLGSEPFMCTYGDALSDVDLNLLHSFHKSMSTVATVTSVRPPARFGEIISNSNGLVTSFREKPQTEVGWINGGFFVFEPSIFDFISDESTVLEKEPLESLADEGNLSTYRHTGFWQCMDTKRDLDTLNRLYQLKTLPSYVEYA
jgi:glucose-1-phosphate cytidylyltransferase